MTLWPLVEFLISLCLLVSLAFATLLLVVSIVFRINDILSHLKEDDDDDNE